MHGLPPPPHRLPTTLPPARGHENAPALLRRAVAGTIERLFGLGTWMLPVVGAGWRVGRRWLREHRVRERVGREAARWAAALVGGVADGVGRGLGAVERAREELERVEREEREGNG